MNEDYPFLDQARNPESWLYYAAQKKYGSYMDSGGEYNENSTRKETEWRSHSEYMRFNFTNQFFALLRSRDLFADQVNLAVIGPGMKPTQHDFGEYEMQLILNKVQHLISIDFCTLVARHALEDFRGKDELRHKVMAMNFDITRGYSAALAALIQKVIVGEHPLNPSVATSEDNMYELAERLGELSIEDLNDILLQERQELKQHKETAKREELPQELIGGGENVNQTLALSINGEPLETHIHYLPMVLAGTGAPYEQSLWSLWEEVTSDTERGANPSSNKTIQSRRNAIAGYFNFIANYNTLAAFTAIKSILDDNPHSKVIAISDVSTIFNGKHEAYPDDQHPRLLLDLLKIRLKAEGILMGRKGNKGIWNDEPEHSHEVETITFERKEGTVRKPSGIEKLVQLVEQG